MGAGNELIWSRLKESSSSATTYYIKCDCDEVEEEEYQAESFWDEVLEDLRQNPTGITYQKERYRTEHDQFVCGEFENSQLVLVSTDYDNRVALALIPLQDYYDFRQEVEEESKDQHYHNFLERLEARVERKWEQYLEKVHREANNVMRHIHQLYPGSLYVRCGAWTSGHMGKPEEVKSYY